MQVLIMISQFLLAIVILVTVHELGHFLFGRLFKVRIEKFFVLMDVGNIKLFSVKRKGTEYGIGWLPLGGYVKLSGMIDESMDTAHTSSPPQPYEFRSKPVWQRLIIMVAGVVFNVILAIIICAGILFVYDKAFLPNNELRNGIYAYREGRSLGFRTGDKIVSINNNNIIRFSDALSSKIMFGARIVVNRNGANKEIRVPSSIKRKMKALPIFYGAENYPFKVEKVLENGLAAKAGVLAGDRIIKLDSQKIEVIGEFREYLQGKKGKTIFALIDRDGVIVRKTLQIDSLGMIGIAPSGLPYNFKKYTALSSISYGASDAIEILRSTVVSFKLLLSGDIDPRKGFAGPIGIAKFFGGLWDWERFWRITAMLSIGLAFLNILPIPALDGGHVTMLLVEWIKGSPVNEKFLMIYQTIGIIFILVLMIFTFGNDIFNLFN